MAIRIYKAAQGRYVRIGSGVFAGLVSLALAYYLWGLLARHVPEAPYKTTLVYAIPAALFVALGGVTFYYLNKPVVVDFLVATESEMKKVSWPGRSELLGSTLVVLVTVILLGVFIFVADYVFSSLLGKGFPVPGTDLRIPGFGLW